MTVTPGNLAMGPGALYLGTFGAAEPRDDQVNSTPAASAWTDVGGTLGGLTLSVMNTWKELEVDQITETPERRRVKKEVALKTQLAEQTHANLILALAGGTSTPGPGYDVYDPATDDSGTSPTYQAFIFDGFGGAGHRRRVIGRKVLSTENVEISASKETQSVYPVTFTTHYVSSAIKSYKVISSST